MKMRQRRKLSRPTRPSWFDGVVGLIELAGCFDRLGKALIAACTDFAELGKALEPWKWCESAPAHEHIKADLDGL